MSEHPKLAVVAETERKPRNSRQTAYKFAITGYIPVDTLNPESFGDAAAKVKVLTDELSALGVVLKVTASVDKV